MCSLRKAGRSFTADAVVLATDVPGLRRIVAASPGLGDATWRDRVAALQTAPPFVVLRLWLDRPVRADRAPFVGTGGREPLDNVSVVSRYEAQARQWAARTGGSVVELHAYSVSDEDGDDMVREALLKRMYELYPETVDATIVARRLVSDASRAPHVSSRVGGDSRARAVRSRKKDSNIDASRPLRATIGPSKGRPKRVETDRATEERL